MRVEIAADSFLRGNYKEANDMFYKLRPQGCFSSQNWIPEVWRDSDGNDKIFDGKVGRSSGAIGRIMAVPENFQVVYYRTTPSLESLRESSTIRFKVWFSAKGAMANILFQQ